MHKVDKEVSSQFDTEENTRVKKNMDSNFEKLNLVEGTGKTLKSTQEKEVLTLVSILFKG